MRRLVYHVASTIDGFIAGPEGQYDFLPFEADLGAYTVATWPETLPTAYRVAAGIDEVPNARYDAVLMGRGTYEPALKAGITSPYAHLEQYVFSRTLAPETDPTVRFVTGPPVEFVRGLKRQEGRDIWLCGGGQLAAELQSEIDELTIKLNPVVAGTGIPLFSRGFDPRRFALVETRPFDSGVVLLSYRPT
ncbi:dihydrofolate reductase family protein [Solwaraspora sp. WMMD1047]|uniref:dihydrofolate reductase family protein n=1 Tax=Solwaraspora sp. WMMD1047 TaxID=3016102 RepID=UPI0024170C9B|nr:dihydrofolate reductase family protein [Solwaraspora sp. WMMD1047]MDG4832605.1 dihydrofolate reductase family protein [Solwaraspora sp. WMMD1047]